jgi:hypothetical protein
VTGPSAPPPAIGEGSAPSGRGIIRASWLGTGLYVLVAAGATIAPAAMQAALLVTCVGLFLAGTAAFLVAYAVAVSRSREEAIGMGGLFFLAGSAPSNVRMLLLGSFAVQMGVALLSATIGLLVLPAGADNPLAFGILTPMYGLGLAGLWGARHGEFGPRTGSRGDGERPAAGVTGRGEGPG